MQWCRTAHLEAVRNAEHVLLVGEGPGRFLTAVLKANPNARCTCVDGSGAMLEEARKAVAQVDAKDRVALGQHDLLQWTPAPASADVLATHFFLDCFTEAQLGELTPRLARSLKPGGAWIVSDFRVPQGAFHLPARLLLKVLYAFFRRATHIPADHLADPAPHLSRSGLMLESCKSLLGGVLQSELWRKPH